MAVRLGTVAPVGFSDFADPQWLECMRALGCQSVQVYRNRHGNDDRHEGDVTVQQMVDYIATVGFPCDSIHGLYGNDLDPSTAQEPGRHAAVETFKAEGHLAKRLGGPLVVIHCAGIYREGVSEGEQDIRWRQMRRSMAELGAFGQEIGVSYAFENLPPYHAIGWDIHRLVEAVRAVNLPNVGVCFDVAHAHIHGDAIAAARLALPVTNYIHVCDNHGEADEHLMPFEGTIDWDGFADAIAEAGYAGPVMLETFYKIDNLRERVEAGLGDRLAAFLDRANGA